ncbi:unnamed protein product [Trifolium pratense]|uniref:Uncharacterized protein n=1 Tax=Trifolium pratense TaxID=57577 RepID=A0ACB0ILN1_TRIPR|nr:unnamed protein product [Trifolium pratense]
MMLTPGAITSGLRIEGFVKLCLLAENIATAGALDFPITVPQNSIRASGLVVEFIFAVCLPKIIEAPPASSQLDPFLSFVDTSSAYIHFTLNFVRWKRPFEARLLLPS